MIIIPTVRFIINSTWRFTFFRNFPTKKVIKNHHDSAPIKILAKPNKIENSFSSGAIKLKRAKNMI